MFVGRQVNRSISGALCYLRPQSRQPLRDGIVDSKPQDQVPPFCLLQRHCLPGMETSEIGRATEEHRSHRHTDDVLYTRRSLARWLSSCRWTECIQWSCFQTLSCHDVEPRSLDDCFGCYENMTESRPRCSLYHSPIQVPVASSTGIHAGIGHRLSRLHLIQPVAASASESRSITCSSHPSTRAGLDSCSRDPDTCPELSHNILELNSPHIQARSCFRTCRGDWLHLPKL
ncbi:hypothetical protein CONLIGDRAFT_141940 [Coniochaeta ligniaria NRRL 30616]|uniref:Uncharacterized protein n=1 Tax=Coniochaeta ligniaria NRRL 30616 TaxID=1408157 RepID=A0A1J7J272_9PEZI|nr:hypothetical protein CONLIGDRAFT_141940 [Coniochaeta ligniaria NRRL 30616]